MKKKLAAPESRPLADFLPTITIKAKDLAAEITENSGTQYYLIPKWTTKPCPISAILRLRSGQAAPEDRA